MIDHNFYASPVQASQTLITHILEAMNKEKSLNGLLPLLFPEGLLLPHFLRFGSVNMPHIPLGPVFISIG